MREDETYGYKKLSKYLADRTAHSIGYPINLTYRYQHLSPLLLYAMNNVGDPFIDSNYQITTRPLERKVIKFFAKLYKMSPDDTWGYVTSGGTEGNLFALFLAREMYPQSVLYFSSETHYSIPKSARLLKLPHEIVPTQPNGEINYELLEKAFARHHDRPAIINANIGTTMKGAIDNVLKMVDLLAAQKIKNYYIHADAALLGMVLPFIKNGPCVDFQNHISSVAISGHKFIGSPVPCGIVLAKKKNVHQIEQKVEYIGTLDSTILGSRSGHGPLFMYEAIRQNGIAGFSKQAHACLSHAKYLYKKLSEKKYPCFLNTCSNIVVLKRPPKHVEKKWQLACQGEWTHVVVMQQVNRKKIDEFLSDLFSRKSK